MRQSMRAEQVNADARLNDLVAKMNAARGEKKVDALASEMMAQREARHEKMAEMQNCPMMPKHGNSPAQTEERAGIAAGSAR